MSAGFVLGVDFGGTKIAMATARPDGEVLRRARLATRAEDGAKTVLGRALDAARHLAAETAADCDASEGGRLVAAGVATFGVVRDDRVLLAPNVPGWEDLPLPRLLREGLGAPVVRLDNDVNAATAAELRWGGLAGTDTGLYVNLGTGLGAGVVAGGRVLRGANGAAGEIGYLLRSPGEPGHAAGRAPLEEQVSGGGLARRASELAGREITARELFGPSVPAGLRGLRDRALDDLGMAIANLAISIDPERIVLGGGMAAEPELVARLDRLLARTVPFPPVLKPAHFGTDAALRGALALALDALP
ncbi:ROK family protein [Actinomadura rupiterrae]|uniref:ROK family protein n=1 Tax=Actinomadura rupiterrae TaxID=559627 RepID=UPI0020A26846|nr:ROK family protein [Actinomadura rupiterrae]MCP2339834.1 glucokinase [Actinomadura rupiterrae]